jgi:UPF0755 protein
VTGLGAGAALLAIAAAAAYGVAAAPYLGYEEDSILVVIPRGSPPAHVASLLHEAGVIRSPFFFRALVRLRFAAERLKAGEYLFEGPARPGEVLSRIVGGDVYLHRITIPEGLAGRAVIERIGRKGLAVVEELESAFRDASPIRDLDPEARDLEGYLFPDTYHFPRGIPAARILEEMVARFRRELDEGLLARAAETGMTLREVVTIASLIEKETSIPEERDRISAVFHNRLQRGMPLQCDPTVIYALAAEGLFRGTLTREDLEYASPYNTYLHPGLPPGPIASPGRASLEAAVSPASVRDLYFVADGTGGHAFSISLEDHLRAVERYRHSRKKGA